MWPIPDFELFLYAQFAAQRRKTHPTEDDVKAAIITFDGDFKAFYEIFRRLKDERKEELKFTELEIAEQFKIVKPQETWKMSEIKFFLVDANVFIALQEGHPYHEHSMIFWNYIAEKLTLPTENRIEVATIKSICMEIQ